ncbi:MAG: 4Fe-4S dicluster domain-containing protein [Candidatus Aureabacteria bacterium]|nr:4Fe-4S dicluster domain-containing protein [Candidatus Auribacterota bacterium]
MPADLRKIDAKKCTGCRICELVCSLHHSGAINPQKSRIRVYRLEDRDAIETCRHCATPKCVPACPTGALAIANDQVVYVKEKCDLCGACIAACPFPGALRIFDGELLKCDFCGGELLCAKYCMMGAVTEKKI